MPRKPKSFTLKKGATLFHGTNAEFEETSGLNAPVWMTTDAEPARYFSTFHRDSGVPRLTSWEINQRVKLAVLTSEFLDQVKEDWGYTTNPPDDLLLHLRQQGFAGWIIPDNYGPGQPDICLDSSGCLSYLDTEVLGPAVPTSGIVEDYAVDSDEAEEKRALSL